MMGLVPCQCRQVKSHATAHPSPPVWAVDPADPGPDLPPTGRSLFDFVPVAVAHSVSLRSAVAQDRREAAAHRVSCRQAS